MLSALFALCSIQFDFGRSPAKAPLAGMKLVLELASRPNLKSVTLRVFVQNPSSEPVNVDPTMLSSSLLTVTFFDSGRKIIHYKGDDIGEFVPLAPERAVELFNGGFIGFERSYRLTRWVNPIFVQASCAYKDIKKHGNIWEGKLISNWLKIMN